MKIGDRIYSPHLKKSGEIVGIYEYNNPYCQGFNYHVLMDDDNKKGKLESPITILKKEHLKPDNLKAIQLQLI